MTPEKCRDRILFEYRGLRKRRVETTALIQQCVDDALESAALECLECVTESANNLPSHVPVEDWTREQVRIVASMSAWGAAVHVIRLKKSEAAKEKT